MEQEFNDIRSNKITDNETWNTCPICDYNWKDPNAIPGLIHRTRICSSCMEDRKNWHGKTRKRKVSRM
jgi:hypothetical protein